MTGVAINYNGQVIHKAVITDMFSSIVKKLHPDNIGRENTAMETELLKQAIYYKRTDNYEGIKGIYDYLFISV